MISTIIFRLDKSLKSLPDTMLTFALLTVAGTLVLVAMSGKVPLKAVVLGWVVAP